jgi:hypothetical protein
MAAIVLRKKRGNKRRAECKNNAGSGSVPIPVEKVKGVSS